jgi:hypothetical protein
MIRNNGEQIMKIFFIIWGIMLVFILTSCVSDERLGKDAISFMKQSISR